MGATRPPEVEQPPVEGTNLEEEVAAAIAALLISGATAQAIAEELILLLPSGILLALKRSLSLDIAEVVLEDPIPTPRRSTDSVAAYMEEIAYRAMYGVKAIQRVGKAALDGDLQKGFDAEKTYYQQHKEAARQRSTGRALNDAAVDKWGPILSWNHTGGEMAKTHRASHKRAHGKNFRADSRPRATNGARPGEDPNCHCSPGPPIKGARILR